MPPEIKKELLNLLSKKKFSKKKLKLENVNNIADKFIKELKKECKKKNKKTKCKKSNKVKK